MSGTDFRFKDHVRVVNGFYKGHRGKLIREGKAKALVRFRVGLFRRYDVWVAYEDLHK